MSDVKKLLIVGAGGQGRFCREIALAMGCFEKIDFIDDNSGLAVGKLSEIESFKSEYDCAFVALGNNRLRSEVAEKLEALGFEIPVLIHPTAYISPCAVIGKGTVIAPKAVINTGAVIGEGCIASIGSLIDHDSSIGSFVHVNTGAICMAGSKVPAFTKVDAGEVYK